MGTNMMTGRKHKSSSDFVSTYECCWLKTWKLDETLSL